MQMPDEMRSRGVVMFDGLRTLVGQSIAQAFVEAFEEAGKEKEPDEVDLALSELFGDPVAQERSPQQEYNDRIEAGRDAASKRAVEALSSYQNSAKLTPEVVLLLADLVQMSDALHNVDDKIYGVLPAAFKSDDSCQEDFGSVSQRKIEFALILKPDYREMVLRGSDPNGSKAFLEDGRPAGCAVYITHTVLADRYLQDPLCFLRELVSVSTFVRESREASMANFMGFYAPELLAQEKERQAAAMAASVIAVAKLGRPKHSDESPSP